MNGLPGEFPTGACTGRELEIPPNKRQQDKIIAVLSSGNWDLLNSGRVDLSERQRDLFLQRVARGDIDEGNFRDLVLHIQSPIYYELHPSHPVELYSHFVADNPQVKGLIAYLVYGDFYLRDRLTPEGLGGFLKRYPEPLGLEKDVQRFLGIIERANSPEKRREYESSLREFLRGVYGKRYEYYVQIGLLQLEADAKYPGLAKERETRRGARQQANEWEKNQVLENFQIETIGYEDAIGILQKVEIHGDPFMGESLTPEILKDEGLMPKYKIQIGDSVVWFSSSGYELSGGRIAVVAYVEKHGQIVARSYYRSNSQGVWRYLPDYKMNDHGRINWYGKGYGEESITLPVVMQRALSEITREGMPILKLKRNPDFIFAGTARKLGLRSDEYYQETEVTPRKLDGNFYSDLGRTPPEQIRLSPEQSPDFSNLLTRWEQDTGIYGQITVEVFPSRDGTLRFMFCKDSLGKVWIGGVEDDSETQSTGLKRTWVKGGDLTTPAFEYVYQTNGYGNYGIRNGSYVDMYEGYLKKIPVIQEYLEASSAR